METEEERKARLEKMVATKQLRLAMETDEERTARLDCRYRVIEAHPLFLYFLEKCLAIPTSPSVNVFCVILLIFLTDLTVR